MSNKDPDQDNQIEEEDLDDQQYEVEAILNHRKIGKTTEYLIKWVGYDDSENTWEPEKNVIENSKEMLQSYWDSVKEKAKNKKAEKAKEHDKHKEKEKGKKEKKKTTQTKKKAPQSKVKIIGCTKKENGDIIFALNIDGENKMLPNSIVKEKYPKDLFAFYESKITIVPYPEIPFTLSNST